MKKESGTGVADETAEPSTSRLHPDSSSDIADDQVTPPAIRSKEYLSNSRKGGPVSPRKPPLPYSRPPEATTPGAPEDSDNSPWDDEVEAPENTSNQFMKPDPGM